MDILSISIAILIFIVSAYLLFNLIKSIIKTAIIMGAIILLIYGADYIGIWEKTGIKRDVKRVVKSTQHKIDKSLKSLPIK